MRREWHFAYFSYPTVIRREIRTKTSFGLKSKVPFITVRFQPDLHCVLRMRTGFQVAYCSHPTAMGGGIRKKTLSASRVIGPSLLPDFSLTCTECDGRAESATWRIWFTPLQCEGRYGRKTVWARRVKCSSLLTDYNLTCTDRNACAGSATWRISINTLQWEGDRNDKLFRPQV
jgi:hypothetical protein